MSFGVTSGAMMNDAIISGAEKPITAPSIAPISFLDFVDSFLYAHLEITNANIIPINKGMNISIVASFIY
jgi:hypothetical protein